MIILTSDFKIGLTIKFNDAIYLIIYFQHVKPGKGAAFVRTKLKNLKNNTTLEKTFRAGEKVEKAYVEKKTFQYLYKEKENYIFMDISTYDQISLSRDQIGEKNIIFLKENNNIDILYHENDIIGIEMPKNILLKVIDTEASIKGDTASNITKNAIMETGLIVKVPLFINKEDELIIDTRTREYISRN